MALVIVLIASCIFSIAFLTFWNIFAILIPNSFSGSLTIFSSFTWSFAFLVCSFCAILLYLLIFSISCVWDLIFPGFRSNSISFWFLPLVVKVGPEVCVDFCWVWHVLGLSWEEVSSPCPQWTGLYEVEILFANLWVFCCLLSCLSEAPCIGCCWRLVIDRSYIQVEAFVGILTN